MQWVALSCSRKSLIYQHHNANTGCVNWLFISWTAMHYQNNTLVLWGVKLWKDWMSGEKCTSKVLPIDQWMTEKMPFFYFLQWPPHAFLLFCMYIHQTLCTWFCSTKHNSSGMHQPCYPCGYSDVTLTCYKVNCLLMHFIPYNWQKSGIKPYPTKEWDL